LVPTTEETNVNDKTVMTVDEAAEELRLSRNATYEAVARKEIPSIRIGRRILIPRAEFRKMLEAG